MTADQIKAVFNLRSPNAWQCTIGATGISARIPDEEKWCITSDPRAMYLFTKEFTPQYFGNGLVPGWDYWMQYGVVINVVNGGTISFKEFAEVYGQDEVMKHLARCMPKYIPIVAAPPDPYPNAVPMPGADKSSPRIKDVKGERLD